MYGRARRHVWRGRAFYWRFNGCRVLGYNRRQVLFLHSNQHLDAGLYPAMPSSPADNRGDVWRWWSSGSGYLAVFLVIRQRDCRTIERHSNLDALQYGRVNPHHNLDSQLRYHKLHRNKHLRFSGVCRRLLPDFGQVQSCIGRIQTCHGKRHGQRIRLATYHNAERHRHYSDRKLRGSTPIPNFRFADRRNLLCATDANCDE